LTFGQTYVDYEQRIDVDRMAKQRLDKVKAGIKKYNLGGLLALDLANSRYFIGSRPFIDFGGVAVCGDRYALLPEESEPILFEGGMNEGLGLPKPTHWWRGDRIRTGIACGGFNAPSEIREAHQMQLRKFANQIKVELKANKVLGETLGVIPDHRGMVDALVKAGVKVDLEKPAKLMRECREVKTIDEIECLRIACSISEACTEEVKRAIRPGVTERELAAIIARRAYEMGSEGLSSFHVESGPHTWPNIMSVTDRSIRPGDIIYCEIAVIYLGYRNCYYTGAYSCGRPSQAQKDAWTRALGWTRAMVKAIKPGATSKDIAEKMPSNKEFGYPDEDSSMMMQWCHGIGLSTPEWPSIHRIWSLKYPYPIKEDMCLAVEAICPTGERSVDYPNGQACRLEDCVHVTAGGIDWLTKWPRDEIMACEI
jgi:Xaa-Pro aminopeptidase